MNLNDPQLMPSDKLHESILECYKSGQRLGQAWLNKFGCGLSWPEVFYEESDTEAAAKIYQMFCEPDGIPMKTFQNLPPGRSVGLYVIRDMCGEVCRAVCWSFREPLDPEIRTAFFRLDNGEYLTDV